MTTISAIGGAFAAAFLLATMPAPAQTGQNATPGAGMSDHDMAGHGMKGHEKPGHDGAGRHPMAGEGDAKRCKTLSHADAMKDAACAALMQAHPGMMHQAPGQTM